MLSDILAWCGASGSLIPSSWVGAMFFWKMSQSVGWILASVRGFGSTSVGRSFFYIIFIFQEQGLQELGPRCRDTCSCSFGRGGGGDYLRVGEILFLSFRFQYDLSSHWFRRLCMMKFFIYCFIIHKKSKRNKSLCYRGEVSFMLSLSPTIKFKRGRQQNSRIINKVLN